MGERSIGCFDFHSLGKCSLGYICHCSQFKGLQNIKKKKLFYLKTGTTLKKNFEQKVSRGCIFTDTKTKEIQWRQKLVCSRTSFLKN